MKDQHESGERAGDVSSEATAREEARIEFLTMGCPYPEEQEPVRRALRALAASLREVDAHFGELGVEARLVWFDSLLPLREIGDVMRALSHVGAVCAFVDNWSDCVRSGTPTGMRISLRKAKEYGAAAVTIDAFLGEVIDLPEEHQQEALAVKSWLEEHAKRIGQIVDSAEDDALTEIVEPARVAAAAALAALYALVDAMRERAPEMLK